MELVEVIQNRDVAVVTEQLSSSDNFIVSNTKAIDFDTLKNKCIIPVFAKDNETTISHNQFVEGIGLAAQNWFRNEIILSPAIRVSHPIKGRVPKAMGKPAKFLSEEEKTVYWERMAFTMDIPSIKETVNGNELSLSIGGVRAYNQENLYSKKTEEKFKIFIGFKNMVCTNLCVSTDGFMGEIRARSVAEIVEEAFKLFSNYNALEEVKHFATMKDYSLSEKQFAQLVGRSRMYQYLPPKVKKDLPRIPLMDSQISIVTRDYYADESFSRNEDGKIDLWRLYNLFTGANKSSYIDTFLDRGAGSHSFVRGLHNALKSSSGHWFIN